VTRDRGNAARDAGYDTTLALFPVRTYAVGVAPMTKKKGIVLGVAGGCLGLSILALAFVSYLGWNVIRWDYPAADYDPMLTREAARALPLIKAIDRYREEHSSLPADMADLAPYLPARPKPLKVPTPESARSQWMYTRLGVASYDLDLRLDWDPSLHYRFENSKGYWYFDPGLGNEGTDFKIIKLNPRAG
jgi:hypothetical protein